MPALDNPRWEAFAQAIVKGLASDKPNGKNTQRAAYLAAGYSTTNDNATDAAASRLLRNVKPVVERIRELQAQALARLEPKLDISRERIAKRLDLASKRAEALDKPADIISAELGLAKVFHRQPTAQQADQDYSTAKSMTDIGRRLLKSIGFNEPDDISIQAAVEANDAFIDALRRIKQHAETLTVDPRVSPLGNKDIISLILLNISFSFPLPSIDVFFISIPPTGSGAYPLGGRWGREAAGVGVRLPTLHAANQRIQQEAGKPCCGRCALRRPLQLLPCA